MAAHLRERHNISLTARRGLSQFVRSACLPDPNTLRLPADSSEPYRHLVIQAGAACLLCTFRSTSGILGKGAWVYSFSDHDTCSLPHQVGSYPICMFERERVGNGIQVETTDVGNVEHCGARIVPMRGAGGVASIRMQSRDAQNVNTPATAKARPSPRW